MALMTLGGMMIKVGDTVRVWMDPPIWDEDDNAEAYDAGDEEAYDPDEFPGFNHDMYDMLGNEYTVEERHPLLPWCAIRDESGSRWWFHSDWLKVVVNIQLRDEDMKSKYKAVIMKIKRMEQKRKGAGYAF